MAEERQPPRGRAPPTAARSRQGQQPHCERGLSDGETAGEYGPNAVPSSEHRCAPSRGPEGGRTRRMQEGRSIAATREVDPFLKEDSPSCALEFHGQSLPHCVPRIPPYDTGARPHASYRQARSTKKANHHTRSTQPPRGYTPLHFRSNQRSGRRTAAQGTCNRPAVM
jgi:hypothetical protein